MSFLMGRGRSGMMTSSKSCDTIRQAWGNKDSPDSPSTEERRADYRNSIRIQLYIYCRPRCYHTFALASLDIRCACEIRLGALNPLSRFVTSIFLQRRPVNQSMAINRCGHTTLRWSTADCNPGNCVSQSWNKAYSQAIEERTGVQDVAYNSISQSLFHCKVVGKLVQLAST